MSVSDEVNREVVGAAVVTLVPEGNNTCQEPFERKLVSLSRKKGDACFRCTCSCMFAHRWLDAGKAQDGTRL